MQKVNWVSSYFMMLKCCQDNPSTVFSSWKYISAAWCSVSPSTKLYGRCIFIISGSKFFKIAKVVPIFKAESRILSSDYRPVSLLSNIGKIIEKLMYKRPNVFLEKKHLLRFSISVQIKLFHQQHSLTIVESIQSHLDQNKFSAGVFVDLKKAFDTVDHHILLQKLEHCIREGLQMNGFHSI